VAWLTSKAILAALARLQGVSIIVQKEDFLRPDIESGPNWARRLRNLYESLPVGLSRFDISRLESMDICGNSTLHPVRCVGNYNAEKAPAFPRSHHKFVVFCHWNEGEDECGGWKEIEPYAVWTGSFNFTETANRSFENALILRDPN